MQCWTLPKNYRLAGFYRSYNLRSSFLLAVHQHHKQFNEKSVINIKGGSIIIIWKDVWSRKLNKCICMMTEYRLDEGLFNYYIMQSFAWMISDSEVHIIITLSDLKNQSMADFMYFLFYSCIFSKHKSAGYNHECLYRNL